MQIPPRRQKIRRPLSPTARSLKNKMERVYVFQQKVDANHYKADAFIVRCFDNRFWKTFKRFMKHLEFQDIDPESVAGGAKIFSDPEREGDRDFMLRELEKSIRLHGVNRVMLFTHHDCGAYGGLTRFDGDEDKEFIFHVDEHKKAQEEIRKRFPELPIESYFIDREGVIKIS